MPASALLRQHFFAAVPIEADGRCGHENRGLMLQLADCRHKLASSIDTAFHNAFLHFRRPAL